MLTTASQLREEFDAAFAKPHQRPVHDLEAFVTIQVGERPYALRVTELSGIHADIPITPVPSTNPAALGLCGIQGAGVPVFSLGQLLGEPTPNHALRWIAVSAGRNPIAFAFNQFEGYVQVSLRDVGETSSAQTMLTGGVLRRTQEHRPVVQIASLVALICDAEIASTGK